MTKAQSEGLGSITEEELFRLRMFQTAVVAKLDNVHYQYQQGFIDDEYFNTSFRSSVRMLAPVVKALNLMPERPSFREYIEGILAEERL
jgi:hypothetical protein